MAERCVREEGSSERAGAALLGFIAGRSGKFLVSLAKDQEQQSGEESTPTQRERLLRMRLPSYPMGISGISLDLSHRKEREMSDSALALSLALFHCWTIGTTLVAVEDLHSPRQRVAWKRRTLAFDACSIRRVRARQVVTALDRICDILRVSLVRLFLSNRC